MGLIIDYRAAPPRPGCPRLLSLLALLAGVIAASLLTGTWWRRGFGGAEMTIGLQIGMAWALLVAVVGLALGAPGIWWGKRRCRFALASAGANLIIGAVALAYLI
jgi:hypothetical protein